MLKNIMKCKGKCNPINQGVLDCQFNFHIDLEPRLVVPMKRHKT